MKEPRFPLALSILPLFHQGKTRDTFELPDGNLLVVATDRLSTHNIVHESVIPLKGEVLTALTIFWLVGVLERAGIKSHLVAFGQEIYEHLPGNREDYPADLHRRAIVIMRLQMIRVEFIYRNYLCGSLYSNYYAKGLSDPYGLNLPPGLQLMAPFAIPAFTPTDKSETDDPLDWETVATYHLEAHTLALKIFISVRRHLRSAGVEFVDSKFELGLDADGSVRIADEVATPDSSRFCEKTDIRLGMDPPWLDKQVARDEAMRIWNGGKKVSLEFSPEIIDKVSVTYLGVFERITGQSLQDFRKQYLD